MSQYPKLKQKVRVTFFMDFFSLTSYLLFVSSDSHIPGKQHCKPIIISQEINFSFVLVPKLDKHRIEVRKKKPNIYIFF